MKFIIDAQLPFRLAKFLKSKGFDAIHTDSLPNKERTTDDEIRTISVFQKRIVITKDSDFLDSHLVRNVPPKLLMVITGNIVNSHLIKLFEDNLDGIVEKFEYHDWLELSNTDLIAH
jgi:predicted nuclease of predicted toxin-antitoxin system